MEARPQSTSRKIVATQEIDLTDYKEARIYGVHYWSYSQGDAYTLWFGVMKPNCTNSEQDPINSFVTTPKKLIGLNDNNFISVDISDINGVYNVGAYGIGSWDTYKFEFIRKD